MVLSRDIGENEEEEQKESIYSFLTDRFLEIKAEIQKSIDVGQNKREEIIKNLKDRECEGC